MRVAVTVPATQECLAALLEGIVLLNVEILARSPLPPLYRAGVVWRAEAGTEDWLTCDRVFARRWGDCEDLACWRAAELRIRGEGAIALPVRAGHTRTGGNLWHVLTERANGDIEDPSRVLGMGRNAHA